MSVKPVYQLSDYGDRLDPGQMARIEHRIYLKDPDFSELLGNSQSTLNAMRQESVTKEKVIFSKLRASLQEWAEQAANTQLLDKALQYVKRRQSSIPATAGSMVNTTGTGSAIPCI